MAGRGFIPSAGPTFEFLGGKDLIRAAGRGDRDQVGRLLRLVKLDRQASRSENASCIIRGIESRDEDKSAVRRLLEFSTEIEGFTALHVAASAGHSRIVDKLVTAIHSLGLTEEELTALMNSKDCIGRTPLHHASWMQRGDVTTRLLGCKHVDVNAKDADNFTPAHLVLLKCNGDVKALRRARLLDSPDIKLHDEATQSDSTKKLLVMKSTQARDGDLRNVHVPLSDYVLPDSTGTTTPMQLIVPKGLESRTAKELRGLDAVWCLENDSVNEEIVGEIEKQLRPIVESMKNSKARKSLRLGMEESKCWKKSEEPKSLDIECWTVMHLVAFLQLSSLMRILVKLPELFDINAQNSDKQSPLHLAVLLRNRDMVEILNEQPKLTADVEDSSETGQTAAEIAYELGERDIFRILMRREDMKGYEGRQEGSRSRNVDGTNGILVGASVIAGITFSGWLQPPLGYQQYYQYPREGSSDDFEQYAAITDYTSVKIFWLSNSLSFYFAIGSLLAAAGAVVPRKDAILKTEGKRVMGALYLASFAFSWAVLFVFVAFTAAGFASLPPIVQYRMYMTCTMLVGLLVCYNTFSSARSVDITLFMKCAVHLNPSRYFSNTICGLFVKYGSLSRYNSTRVSYRIEKRKPEPPSTQSLC